MRSAHEKLARREALVAMDLSERAIRNILWLEDHCKIPDGKLVGKPLVVADFMCEDLDLIFRDPEDIRGPVSKAIISRPRKNAKSVEAAMIALLYLLGPEAAPMTEVYSGAMAREQAAILFKLLSRMIRMNPDLLNNCSIKDSTKEITVPDLGSYYRAMSKDGKTAHGLSPRLVILDEMGQERKETNDLIEALVSGSAAQEDPLIVAISTQAPNDGAWLSKEIDNAIASEDPAIVVRVDGARLDHPDPFSREALEEANPAWAVWQNQEYMLQQAKEAARLPSKQASFRNLYLNQRVSAEEPFIERAIWAECSASPKPLSECLSVFGGLDLSEVRDLTALVLVGIDEDGGWHVHPTFWLPHEGIEAKSDADAVPYDRWEEEGFLQTTPGRTVDYGWVAEQIWELVGGLPNLKGLAFDRYNWRHFRPYLEKEGFTEDQLEGDEALFREFGQGFISMSPAVRTLESAILDNHLRHGDHPILTMCMANTRLQKDPAGNRKPAKHKSTGRIDGMVSLTMAAGLVGDGEPEATSSMYMDDHEILVL